MSKSFPPARGAMMTENLSPNPEGHKICEAHLKKSFVDSLSGPLLSLGENVKPPPLK
jgi:hypothetical protein